MMSMHKRSVNVSRINLLSILRVNRDNHAMVYELAKADFYDEKKRVLNQALANLYMELPEEAYETSLEVNLKKPIHFLQQYDEMIEMLEMSVDDTIELDSDAFSCYAKDRWVWSSSFLLSNAKYVTGLSAPMGD